MTNSAERVRRAQASLSALSQADLEALWPKIASIPPERLAVVLGEVARELAAKYGSASAAVAADFYDELRDAAGVSGSFRAVPAELPDAERFAVLGRWAVGPLFDASPDSGLALAKAQGGLSRIVTNAGRETIANSGALDPGQPRYARHASANACPFCRMLASRGAVYSEASATTVGGRGTDVSTNVGRKRGRMAQGIRARGTQSLGDKYHDHCHCTSVPVWPGQEYEEAPYVAGWREQYAEAVDTTKGKYGAIDVKKTLANWRQL